MYTPKPVETKDITLPEALRLIVKLGYTTSKKDS